MVKTCYIRTHKIRFKKNIEIATINIYNEINRALNDGYTRFVAGIEGEADIIFAETIHTLKSEYPDIKLEIEIPNTKELAKINENPIYEQLFKICDGVSVIRTIESHHIECELESFTDVRYIDI